MTNYIAEAIEEAWGERCPEFNPDCHCCRAWKQYEDLVASLAETLAVAARNEEGEGGSGVNMERLYEILFFACMAAIASAGAAFLGLSVYGLWQAIV